MKKLKCALVSDSHYGFDKNTHKIHEKFWKKLAQENIDVLFWAGDIGSSKPENVHKSMVMARQYLPNVTILVNFGNHCYWSGRPDKLPWKQDISLYSYRGFYDARAKLPPRKRPMHYGQILESHKKVAQENNIVILDGDSFNLTENIVVLGFMGWYKETKLGDLSTKDYKYLPENVEGVPIHVYLSYKAEKDLEKLLNVPVEGKTVIFMTHFPPFTESPEYLKYCANPAFMPIMTNHADYLLVGHSHRACDYMENDCRVLNCGSDYNDPKYKIFEVDAE
jgi:predicted phosphodiesterase